MARRQRIQFKPIVPKILDPMPFLAREMDIVFDKTNDDLEKRYKKVSDKFRHHRVNYIKRKAFGLTPTMGGGKTGWWSSLSTDHFIMIILDTGPASGVPRYRKMSNNWRSLTRPGRGLRVHPTQGKAAGWFPKGQEPDFEAREFSQHAADLERKVFTWRAFSAFRNGMRAAWFTKK